MRTRERTEPVTTMAGLLSAPIRCAILEALRSGPRIVGDLVDALGESQATVSKQIAILREAGVLVCRPDGRCREYALVDPVLVGGILDGLEALGRTAARQAAECRARRAARMAE